MLGLVRVLVFERRATSDGQENGHERRERTRAGGSENENENENSVNVNGNCNCFIEGTMRALARVWRVAGADGPLQLLSLEEAMVTRGRAARSTRRAGGVLLLSMLTAGALGAQASAGAGGQPVAGTCGGPPTLVTPVAAPAPDAAPSVVRSAALPATVALPTRMLAAPVAGDAADNANATAATPPDEPAIARHGRWHVFVHDLIGPGALIGVGASAGIDQWQGSPPEWGTGGSGFGKRLASRGGQLVAQETVRHGLAAMLGRNPEYQRCGCTDFSGRLNNALAESVTDINESGHRVVSVPRIAGSFAGAFAPLLWRPGLTVPQATRDGALGLLFNAAGNLVTEYIHFGGQSQTAQATRRAHRQR